MLADSGKVVVHILEYFTEAGISEITLLDQV